MTNTDGVALLRGYLGADATHDVDIQRAWESASALIATYIGTSVVPAVIIEHATLLTAAELYERRQSPNGLSQFATPNGMSAVRVARDPMLSAYPLLRRFVGWGVA